ncbi:MAG: hypothetical protein ACR2GW_05595 [Pyrinomonadaceae bacterium]|jgi:LuxR family maltose regulon positive regulatory protein|nr:hypothetical protein [Acidobacteriota bacterium]
MSLINDKITTPTDLPIVPRPRLLETLAESLNCCNSTVISGRTGTGKTMLATDFAGRCGRRVAWYKVDAPEADLHLFLQYLIASVRNRCPGFGRKTLALLRECGNGHGPEDAPFLAESFVYELLTLDDGEPLLLVIDDLHLVYDAEWVVPFFSRLLPLLPPEVHVILTGRTLPPAPLWRMRSKQTLRVVDESALLFNAREAEELFASYGLPRESAARALTETRGRAACIDTLAREGALAKRQADARLNNEARETANAQLRLVKGFAAKTSLRAT